MLSKINNAAETEIKKHRAERTAGIRVSAGVERKKRRKKNCVIGKDEGVERARKRVQSVRLGEKCTRVRCAETAVCFTVELTENVSRVCRHGQGHTGLANVAATGSWRRRCHRYAHFRCLPRRSHRSDGPPRTRFSTEDTRGNVKKY